MGFNSLILRSPKKEEQQVPDGGEDVDIMEDFERILGIEGEDDEKPLRNNTLYCGQLNWDLMDWGINGEDQEDIEEEEDHKVAVESQTKFFFEEESYYKRINVKRENAGFWDDDDEAKRLSLNLNLNYQEVLDAWSDRGSLWAHDGSLSMPTNAYYMGEVPVIEEEKTRREASVLRYKEKRQTRLFSKKIRYQVRKLNADKRPRLKGRFVKRV